MRELGERFGRHAFLVCKVMSHAKVGNFAAAVSINEDCAKSEGGGGGGGRGRRAMSAERTESRGARDTTHCSAA